MKTKIRKLGKLAICKVPAIFYDFCDEYIKYFVSLMIFIGCHIVCESFQRNGSVLGDYNEAVEIFMSNSFVATTTFIIFITQLVIRLVKRNASGCLKSFLVCMCITIISYYAKSNVWKLLTCLSLLAFISNKVIDVFEQTAIKKGYGILSPDSRIEEVIKTVHLGKAVKKTREQEVKEDSV